AFLGVSRSSLRRWDKMDIFHAFRTPGGHRRYDMILAIWSYFIEKHRIRPTFLKNQNIFSVMHEFQGINKKKRVILIDKYRN
ncbi:MAG TPA: MerR family DNA-binding transcriptional regulator, partial [Candidatus Cloacimonetes bacterium]|nr:MerR family DNA-binding transcriptional regulator [Candidatus Cloacimonadota bacterium]